jgi:N-acetylmuramic acid 6-phosphate etherase
MKLPKRPLAVPCCLIGVEAGATRTVAIAVSGDHPEPVFEKWVERATSPSSAATCRRTVRQAGSLPRQASGLFHPRQRYQTSSKPVRHEFGPANLWLLDDRQLIHHLQTIARSMPRPTSLAIGMAGARTAADHARIRRAAAQVWPGVPCYASSDLETGLMAGEEVTPPSGRSGSRRRNAAMVRVLILSGTGSCCFGRAADGRTVRFGGWGHILGDRGSGYEVGLLGLKAVVHAFDHDRKWPLLGQHILRALALNEPENLVGWAQNASKADIAALALEVFRAAAQRDKIAVGILEATARTLASDAAACARFVTRPGTPVQFVLAGSVLLKQPAFATRVQRAVTRLWPRAVVSPLKRESAWGAVELARRNSGAPIPDLNSVPAAREDSPAPTLRALVASPTEQRNPRSMKLDELSLADAVTLMLEEDRRIPAALLAQRRKIERSVKLIVRSLKRGGRLFYVGAGTSGRLGVLDASECPPTFCTPPEMVQGIIAGGQTALWSSVEGAEDDAAAGAQAVAFRHVTRRDTVVGIAASGRTPFVWGALGEAKRRGAQRILVCFNPHLVVPQGHRPDLIIAPNVGPEILTGSTRLKAGTATKLVLNIFTTLAMVRLRKVQSNLMIDVHASNDKLRDRAVRILQALTRADDATARAALERTGWKIREAHTLLHRHQ